jgi:hypothetical protein
VHIPPAALQHASTPEVRWLVEFTRQNRSHTPEKQPKSG